VTVDAEIEVARIPLQVTHGCLIASIQSDLTPAVMARFQADLLQCIRARRVDAVLLDCSGLDLMDGEEFASLRRCMAMASLLGARPVLVGVNPGVAAALVESNADTELIDATATLERGFELVGRARAPTDAG
jgi:rsbT antagonist protein RsbS